MLDGFKVLELATHIAAPAAAGLLSDWGADVIKIESPAGDPMRWLRAHAPGGCTPVFETNNRGKRSLCIDIASDEGREAVCRLIAEADVFITNLRPGSLARAGLDWASLHAAHPDLIYCSVTGYGLRGEAADTPAFDNAAFWARSGFAHLSTVEGGEPLSLRQGTGDHTCALTAALGIVTALLARERGGGGKLVEASLLRTATFVLGADLSNHVRLDEAKPTRTRAAAANPLNNFFRTADGPWVFVMPRGAVPDDPRNICAAAGRADLIDDPRFATAEARSQNGAAMVAQLDAAFAALPFAEAAARLTAARVVWSPVQTPAQLMADPVAVDAGCFLDAVDPHGTAFRTPAPPVRFDSADVAVRGPPPVLGQHTDEILEAVGFQANQINEMRQRGRVR